MITKQQRTKLRSLAQTISPTVHIGKNGLTQEVVQSINNELFSHELIKIKMIQFKEMKRELGEKAASLTNSDLVTVIGNILVLYKENEDEEKRKIFF